MLQSLGKFVSTVTVAAGVLLIAGCGFGPAPEPTPAPVLPPIEAADQVVADAKVVPVLSAELRFETSGTLAELLVKEGDAVEEGKPIARLNTSDLELRVEQAKVSLAQAKANYDKLIAGASAEEIAAAQAQVAQAEAALRQTQGSVTSQDIAAARAQLEEARARLARLQAGPKTTEIESSRAQLDQAREGLESQRAALSTAKTNAQLAMEQAANTLRNAQDEYSRIYWDNRNLDRFPGDLPQELKDREAAALRAVQNAEAALEQAKASFEQARQAEINGIQQAEAQVRNAQAQLDQLLAGADKDVIAGARAQVAQAEARLAQLLGDQRAGSLGSAEASLESARANLARVTADPREAELALATAQVEAAEVGLREAQLALDKATLKAPFAGTIARIDFKVGELVSPAGGVVVMADLSNWEIETDDLTELSVVKIREGDAATITFDALPGFELRGAVSEIKPIGVNKQGDITYTVVIKPQSWDERLRWNMTASVSIEPTQ